MGVRRLQAGTQQPFYHVMVDERDRPGGQTTYVAQVRYDWHARLSLVLCPARENLRHISKITNNRPYELVLGFFVDCC